MNREAMSRQRVLDAIFRLERTDYVSLAIIGLGLGVAWVLTYITGGTHRAFPHTFYVPVIYAAYRFGVPGGVLTGALAMFVCGPILPLNTTEGIEQPVNNWVTRGTFFIVIGGLAGQGFRSLRDHIKRSEQLHEDAVRGFVKMIDAKSPYTAKHSERVAELATAIGREMKLSQAQLKTLYWSALLHDVGKLWIPDSVLNKPGRLTEEEWILVRQHPLRSAEFIASVEEFQCYVDAARSHHERFDGFGYPDGIAGDDIPLHGRILGVADSFEAMTSDRSYRPGLTFREGIGELRAHSGSQFDPVVVEACLRVIETRPATLPSWRPILVQPDHQPAD